MKKLLIISYYWPPGTGAGVYRWLKFSKYLREQGWDAVVYTPSNPEAQGTDHSLEADIPGGMQVLRRKIREPFRLYKLLTGRRKDEKIQSGFLSEEPGRGILDKLAVWIRGNLFIPDARRAWVRPSVRFLSRWLREHPVDAMVSTGPPHSMHLLALELREKTGIPWLADFRDPWTQIDYHHQLMLGPRARRRHAELEKSVLRNADRVLTVSKHCAMGLEEIGERPVDVITNGFDPDDFNALVPRNKEVFRITHMGAMNADRNPVVLWQSLEQLLGHDRGLAHKLRLRFIGRVDHSVRSSLEKHGLESFAEFIAPLPHREALALAADSALLLLAINNTPNARGITTGKLYDYLPLGRPILCIGPEDGDAAKIIQQSRSGVTLDFHDIKGCTQQLLGWYHQHIQDKLQLTGQCISAYDRRRLTARLARLLREMLPEEGAAKRSARN